MTIDPTQPRYFGETPILSRGGVALPPSWSGAQHWRRRSALYCGTGTSSTSTTTGDGYHGALSTELGYDIRGCVGFSVNTNKSTWQAHVTNLFTSGNNNSLYDIINNNAGADTVHFSLDPTFGADLAGVTIPDWGWNPTTTSGTVGGVATTRVERADNVLAYHDTLRGGANDDLLEHLVDTWIANDFVDVHLDIRLMHEMNFTKRLYIAHSPPERAGQLEASFKTLWRHYVDKLRSYTVAQLGYWPPKWKIAFNPGSTVAALSNPQNPGYTWDRWVETWWPGDSYVDVVSFNIYPKTGQDEDVRNVFAGLDRFSRKHRKPMAIYEMGLDVLVEGDNPAVWTLLADEIRKRSPLRWRTIGFFGAVSDAPANNFDIADTGVPNALAEFRAQFGA